MFDWDMVSIGQYIDKTNPRRLIHPDKQAKLFALLVDEPVRPLACPKFDAADMLGPNSDHTRPQLSCARLLTTERNR